MNEIKYFNEFWKPCIEAFNSPASINWTNNISNNLSGEFHIDDDDKYEINCDEWGDDIWTYKFNYNDGEKTSELINKNENKFKTLSTIREGMKYLIDEKNPNGIIITVMDNSRGREFVWDRFSKEISDEYKYEYRKMEILGVKVLMLWKHITFDKMNLAFSKISNNLI